MPKSSNTENIGPSSGSTISFLTELMKCLSPVISSRTTDEINKLKKHLQTIKRVIIRLLDGGKIVPDCGHGFAQIPLKSLCWKYNKRGTPQFHPRMCFQVKEMTRVQMSPRTALTAPIEKVLKVSRSDVFDITIEAFIPGKGRITDFTIKQCTINIPEDETFVSLRSLREAKDMPEFYEHLRRSYVAHNFTLTVHTGFDGYGFIIADNDIQPVGSGCADVPYEVFKPTLALD